MVHGVGQAGVRPAQGVVHCVGLDQQCREESRVPAIDREAPAPFKHAGKYHILTSACTGWGSNPALHAIADHPLGPWTVLVRQRTCYRSFAR